MKSCFSFTLNPNINYTIPTFNVHIIIFKHLGKISLFSIQVNMVP